MSEAIAFDTHRFVKNLTASGFTEAQAEALADEQVHLLNSNLATKADIRGTRADLERVKSELEVKIEKVKSELEVKIEQVKAEVHTAKAEILKWMITAMMAQTALVATLIRYW